MLQSFSWIGQLPPATLDRARRLPARSRRRRFRSPRQLEEVVGGLRRLRYAGQDVIVLHVLDHDELTFPFEQLTMFEGLEHPDLRLLADPQSLRRSYLAVVQGFISRVRSTCMDHRIDYALLSTHDPIDAGLSTFLAGRMHRLAR